MCGQAAMDERLSHSSKKQKDNEEEEREESNVDEEAEEPLDSRVTLQISTVTEAMSFIEDVSKFLDNKEHTAEATEACQLHDRLDFLKHMHKMQNMKQLTLDKFFP